jgi:DNA-binding NtrC family response regulator
MARILSIGYDQNLLHTRALILEARGHEVTTAIGMKESLELCRADRYDLVIIGHSMPPQERSTLIHETRARAMPVLVLLRAYDPPVSGAGIYQLRADEGPQALVSTVTDILDQSRHAKMAG